MQSSFHHSACLVTLVTEEHGVWVHYKCGHLRVVCENTNHGLGRSVCPANESEHLKLHPGVRFLFSEMNKINIMQAPVIEIISPVY